MLKLSKSVMFLCAASTLCTASFSQVMNFTGPYDVNNWTTTRSATGGSVDTSGAPNSITLFSPNDGGHNTFIDFSIDAVETGSISFDWSYTSVDGTCCDSGGWVLNGTYTPLVGSGIGAGTPGTVTVPVNQGDVFGFRAFTTDGQEGPGEFTVSSFTAVPEPQTYALAAGIGLLAFAGFRRFKTRSALPVAE